MDDPDQTDSHFKHHLEVAEGYIELGMPLDANEELEQVEPELRDRTEVLKLRARIYRRLEKWDLMQAMAKALAFRDPQHVESRLWWAFATRRAESVQAARLVLLDALDDMPSAAIFHYELACHECQLGDIGAAKGRLKSAFEMDPELRAEALQDEDLEPLWASL